MSDSGWNPARWWRVEAEDGSLWAETSNESEARSIMRPGDTLYRRWVRLHEEWRPVSREADV